MAYYRSCLQRQLYANGRGRTLLVKSTHSSGAVSSLLAEFPDARFITIIRHPYESVASHVSLFVPAWQAHSPEIAKDGPEARAYARLAIEWYKHLHRFRGRVKPENYFLIDYRMLEVDPAATIDQLYRHFGWTPSPEFQAKIVAIAGRQRHYRSKHRYTLEEFGLSPAWVQSELEPVMTAHGLSP